MERLNIEKQGRICILRFSGELTLEVVDKLKEETEQYLQTQDCPDLVLDLSQTMFLDSSGIGLLVNLNNKQKEQNLEFYLLSPSPQVRKTLSLVKLIDFFNILESEEELQQLQP
ncbi:MAG: STAS domain-containing protein [Desulfohalobiaceae bacterium]